MSRSSPKAIVIGAGIGGLASAIRLAAKGFEVRVLEQSAGPGGKMKRLRLDGFTFDTGPSLFTLPNLVDELFQLCGKSPSDYLRYRKLSVITRYFYEDGVQIEAYSDPRKFALEAAAKTGEPARRIQRMLASSKEKYDLTEGIFLQKSLHKVSTFTNLQALKTLVNLPKLEIFKTMDQANKEAFSNRHLIQLFNRYATYNGSNPYQAPATLNVIPHLEHNVGAFFPEGGIYEIALALEKLAKEMGVQFEYEQPVEEIIVFGKKASGVRAKGQTHTADVVVSNVDIYHTYRRLLSGQKAPERILRQPRSSSALIFYWGMKKQFPELILHNLFFSRNYKAEFECLFGTKTVYDDPTVYVYISSKECPGHAPPEHENWFTMINVPANSGQDWEEIVERSRKNIVTKLSRMMGEDLAPYIVCEEVLDPRSIEAKTASWQGALYGNSSNNKFAAFLRHANFTGRIKGLYFVGGSVHPGGGIPLCLLSAKIVGEMIRSHD